MPDTPDSLRSETVIAFDFGLARIGVAVGQQVTRSAGPLGVVANGSGGPDWVRLDALITEWRPSRLLVGLPLHADGSPSPMSRAVAGFAADLGRRYALPVESVDERWSSLEARDALVAGRRAGHARRIRRERVDAAAAVLIAERWLARGRDERLPGEQSPPDRG